jgi:hypothetical protein
MSIGSKLHQFLEKPAFAPSLEQRVSTKQSPTQCPVGSNNVRPGAGLGVFKPLNPCISLSEQSPSGAPSPNQLFW